MAKLGDTGELLTQPPGGGNWASQVHVNAHCANRRRSGGPRSQEAANVDSLYFAAGGEEGGAPEIPQQLPGHGGMAQAIGRGSEDEEVCSETLRIESKIFFCDAKANSRGLYLKISEKGTNRERSTIIVPGQSLPWFRELFNYYATTEPSLATAKEFPVESKVFYWSVGDNPRGRYLRISESGAGPRGKSSIIVPSGGVDCSAWLAFRSALARIEAQTLERPPVQLQLSQLTELESHLANLGAAIPDLSQTTGYLEALSISSRPVQVPPLGQETVVGPGPAPPSLTSTETGSRIVRAGHKRYFFDLGSNNKGHYLRITEVAGQDRIAIIVPAVALPQFYHALGLCLEDQQAALQQPQQL